MFIKRIFGFFFYPSCLLPKKKYKIITPESVKDYYFIRETEKDVYKMFQEAGEEGKEQIYAAVEKEIKGASRPSSEVFEMSLFLYGIFNEKHIGIIVEDKKLTKKDWSSGEKVTRFVPFSRNNAKFPLYLKCSTMFNRNKLEFEGHSYELSYEHKPNLANYWHFQIYSTECNNRIVRDLNKYKNEKSSDGTSLEKLYKRYSKHLLSIIARESICFDKSELKKYKFTK